MKLRAGWFDVINEQLAKEKSLSNGPYFKLDRDVIQSKVTPDESSYEH